MESRVIETTTVDPEEVATRPHGSKIEFRPGVQFGNMIEGLVGEWGVPRGEVAKRLSVLAACGLSARFYPQVARLNELNVQRSGPRREAFLFTASLVRELLDRKAAEMGVGFSDADILLVLDAAVTASATGEPAPVSEEPEA